MRLQILIFFLLFSLPSIAQSVTYEYDNAGERVLRKQSGALPVTLISFTVTKEGTTALLTWLTASEINSDRFDIERSREGKKWLNIGTVKANGNINTNSHYSFIDRTPAYGENLYRLKMVDSDDTFAFSRMQSVYFDAVISFYPNPVKDKLVINGSASGSIQIVNNAGKVVYNSACISSAGVDMSSLSKGLYLVRITHDDGTSVIGKVIKE